MSRSSLRRMILALAVGVVLAGPWPVVAKPRTTAEAGQLQRIAVLPLDLAARLWSLADRVLTKTGCLIDPNGACTPEQGSTADNGCSIDPNGCPSGQ